MNGRSWPVRMTSPFPINKNLWTMPILVFGMNAFVGFVADSLVYDPATASLQKVKIEP
jgi:hypothetical protein